MLCGEMVQWWKPAPPSAPQTPVQVPEPRAKSATLAECRIASMPGMVKWKKAKGAVGMGGGAGSMPVWSRHRGLVLQMMLLALEGRGGGDSDSRAGGRKDSHSSPWLLH